MSDLYRKQREEKGYKDLETLLQALDQIEADCWSKKALIDRALENEDKRRKRINELRAAEGRGSIADAGSELHRAAKAQNRPVEPRN